jgi:leader peptidase (prepilin peptidase)/N-methyltransferase
MMAFRPSASLALAVVYGVTFAVASMVAAPDRLILGAVLGPVLIWLSLNDLARHEIPDTASFIIAVAGLGFQWHLHGFGGGFWVTVLVAGAMTAALWLAGARFFRRTGTEALGIGDAKLIGAGTLCVGAEAVWLLLFIAASGGIVAALMAQRRGGNGALAFGPFLAYAVFIVVNFPLTGLTAP